MQELVHEELLNSLPLKLADDRSMQSCLKLYEQYQTIECSGVRLAPPVKPTTTKILPFSFSLCAEVDIASESTITIEPKVMRTCRNHRETLRKLDTTLDPREDPPPQHPHPTRQTRRLSLTFYR